MKINVNALKSHAQQSHLQSQGLLYVPGKQIQSPIDGLDVPQRLCRIDPRSNGGGRRGNLWKGRALTIGRFEGPEPDVAQPPLEADKDIRPLPAIFRLDGGRQLVLPPLALPGLGILVSFE